MEYYDINDEELLYLINVDEVFKELLYQKYNDRILKICLDCNKVNFNIDIDDLLQEAYLGFSYAINNYDSSKDKKFINYAIMCINGRLKSYVRKYQSFKNKLLNKALSLSVSVGDGVYLKDVIASSNNTVDEVILFEDYKYITEFKNDLPFLQSQIFELKFNGFSYKEIALLLDIDINKISYQIRTIRKKFLNMCEDCCVF